MSAERIATSLLCGLVTSGAWVGWFMLAADRDPDPSLGGAYAAFAYVFALPAFLVGFVGYLAVRSAVEASRD